MKKNLLTKVLLFTVLYVVIFLSFSLIQFAAAGSFSRQLGDLRVSGKFLTAQAATEKTKSKLSDYNSNTNEESAEIEYFVADGVGVYFGGMEFYLSSQELYGLVYIDSYGVKHPIKPQIMILSQEAVKFKLENSIDLSFYIQREGGVEELIISSAMGEDVMGIEVPYRPLKKAKVKSQGADNSERASLFVSYAGQEYMFDRPILDTSRRTVNLNNKTPVIVYKIVPEEAVFNPVDFIVSGAMEKPRYDELVAAWCSKAIKSWETAVFNGTNSEEVITSYVSETARKGSYQSAVDNVPTSFRENGSRTFLSAPFLGRLDFVLRTMAVSERDTTERYSSLIREKTLDILKQDRIFEYLALRGRMVLFDEAIECLKIADTASISQDMCTGVFQAWVAWRRWKENVNPNNSTIDDTTSTVENPITPLLEYAKEILSQSIKIDRENRSVFTTNNNTVDVLYNLRLGIAIEEYGNATGKGEWAALGRSLVLSVLNFADDAALIPEILQLNSENNFVKPNGSDNIGTAVIYRNLRFSDFYPHAVGIDSGFNGLWVWTMSPGVSAVYENSVLDIEISFPVSQTHYILISGVGSFSKIQMRDIDYRSDPQFERYDSPGWAYSISERTLMLKLVHRNPVEHVKIFF